MYFDWQYRNLTLRQALLLHPTRKCIKPVLNFQLSVDLMMKFQSGYTDGEDPQKETASTYHDPLTKTTYSWDATKHQWVPQTLQYSYPDNYQYTDPRTGYTYIWKASEQKWHTIQSQTETNEPTKDKVDSSDAQENDKPNDKSKDSRPGIYRARVCFMICFSKECSFFSSADKYEISFRKSVLLL